MGVPRACNDLFRHHPSFDKEEHPPSWGKLGSFDLLILRDQRPRSLSSVSHDGFGWPYFLIPDWSGGDWPRLEKDQRAFSLDWLYLKSSRRFRLLWAPFCGRAEKAQSGSNFQRDPWLVRISFWFLPSSDSCTHIWSLLNLSMGLGSPWIKSYFILTLDDISLSSIVYTLDP